METRERHENTVYEVVLGARKIANGRPEMRRWLRVGEVVRALVMRAADGPNESVKGRGEAGYLYAWAVAWGRGPCAAAGAKFAGFVA